MTTDIFEENVFSYLKPEGIISMRLAHPEHALSFDRVPRRPLDEGAKTTQSSGDKFSEFDFKKLGDFYVGDIVKLSRPDSIYVPGEMDRIPCQMYFMIKSFYISGTDYFAEGCLLFHSSMRQMRVLVSIESYILVKDRKETMKLTDLKLEQTLRFQNILPRFCPGVYDEAQQTLVRMADHELGRINSTLDESLRDGCVQVVTNIHILFIY